VPAFVLRFGPKVIYSDFLRLRLDLYQFRPDSNLIQIKVSFFSGLFPTWNTNLLQKYPALFRPIRAIRQRRNSTQV
jgi:hypothetical protein